MSWYGSRGDGYREHGVAPDTAIADCGEHARRVVPVGSLVDLGVQPARGSETDERSEVLAVAA